MIQKCRKNVKDVSINVTGKRSRCCPFFIVSVFLMNVAAICHNQTQGYNDNSSAKEDG